MNTLGVELGSRSYPIHIGSGLLERLDLYAPHLRGTRAFVITNETVAPLYLKALMRGLGDDGVEYLVLPDGEEHKNIDTFVAIVDRLLETRFSRDSTLIALGGGVVGDVAGFAAACFQRGVRFIQVPTTLLAQVDSSVGGKTGINHRLGKNMIGCFHQPACVVADVQTLRTLPQRELVAGLAEVIKYALIDDAGLLDWLDQHLGSLLGCDAKDLTEVIYRCCAIKARIVADDEREEGVRAVLNLGHTFGHALETGLGYGVWLHGEAVAAGLCLAADLSVRIGALDEEHAKRILELVARVGLPVGVPGELTSERVIELMGMDKKVRQGRLRLVLLETLGRTFITDAVDPLAVRATLDACRSR